MSLRLTKAVRMWTDYDAPVFVGRLIVQGQTMTFVDDSESQLPAGYLHDDEKFAAAL